MHTVDFGSVFGIAWIPYYGSLDDMQPPNAYHELARSSFRGRMACHLLFATGNRTPDDVALSSLNGYHGLLDSKDYRGAICTTNIRLFCEDSRVQRVEFGPVDIKAGGCIGYTPIRWRGLGRRPAFYSRGVGSYVYTTPVHHVNSTRFSQEIKFRLSAPGNLGARVLTGAWA